MLKRKGFTIIELLVVISIIALLIAILLPSLAGARDRARFIKWKGYSHGLRPDQRMAAYWNFEEQSGTETDNNGHLTLWNRAAGNANDFARDAIEPEDFHGRLTDTVANPTTAIAANPPAWEFTDNRWKGKGGMLFKDTANNFVEIEGHDYLNPEDQSFTIFVWANLYSGASCHCSPLTSRAENSGTQGYIFYANGSAQFWTGRGVAGWETTNTSTVPFDEYSFYGATYERTQVGGGQHTLYFNDEIKTDAGIEGYEANANKNTRIGAGNTNGLAGQFFWDGLIDEVAIFRDALDGDQMLEIYKVGKSRVKR